MNSLLPPRASLLAHRVDELVYAILGVATFFVVLIAVLILSFMVRYHRSRRPQTPQATRTVLWIEVVWASVPLAIMLCLFTWGAKVYLEIYSPGPKNAYEIYVVAKQWMWKFQHPGGQRELDQVHVPSGSSVRFILVSQDVIHSFFVPAFRVKHDVIPMRYSLLTVYPTQTGSYPLFCAEYCGTDHSRMRGQVIVLDSQEFRVWEEQGRGQGGLAARGRTLLEQLGCRSCHRGDSLARAPQFEGLFSRLIHLEDGRTVVADENYIRESILNPGAKVVLGYRSLMPSYQGQVTEEQLIAITAYLKSIGGGER